VKYDDSCALFDNDRWYDDSSDEECQVPPIPVSSDDGSVQFYWAGETPRHVRSAANADYMGGELGYGVGDFAEYCNCMKVEIVAVYSTDCETRYAIKIPDGTEKETVGRHLQVWRDEAVPHEEPEELLKVKRVPSLVTSCEEREAAPPPLGPHGQLQPVPGAGTWSVNEDQESKSPSKKKKGIQFNSTDEVHEIDHRRAANTHLSLEKPLELPFVPPNSLRSGFHWNYEAAMADYDQSDKQEDNFDALDSDDELDRLAQQAQEESPGDQCT